MAAVTYTKDMWKAEADIQRLDDGRYQGVVLLTRQDGRERDETPHMVHSLCESPEEALEEAKALAHRLLAAI